LKVAPGSGILPAMTPDRRYVQLEARSIIQTIAALENRISERFPGSGLSAVCGELRQLSIETESTTRRIAVPIWPLRLGAYGGILLVLVVFGTIARTAFALSPGIISIPELIQATDAGLNVLIFLSIAIYFLFSLEERFKRRAALKSLHNLRSIVHIVDMHQLTKDPEFVLWPEGQRTHPPRKHLTRFQLSRYLDYCSELLSLTSKVAALLVQELKDPVVLEAVSDVENLTSALSNKIWQKIMILDTAGGGGDSGAGRPGEVL
jgi:hypothetical protein